MFTGLVEEIGTVKGIIYGTHSASVSISCTKIMDDVKVGDSIAVNGVCLTATIVNKSGFTADIMHETLNRSSLGSVRAGSHINLERAMLCGGRFGGHIVSGHIDGTGTVKKITKDDNAYWYRIDAPASIMKYVIMKGSITIDGISLTVAETDESGFSVSIIPHTLSETVLAYKKPGDIVNLENDCVAKYIEKLMGFDTPNTLEKEKKTSKITKEFLLENGF